VTEAVLQQRRTATRIIQKPTLAPVEVRCSHEEELPQPEEGGGSDDEGGEGLDRLEGGARWSNKVAGAVFLAPLLVLFWES
jgi:hypothetical protein